MTRHWIDSTLRRRDDEALIIHAAAAIILGQVNLITVVDGAAETELQGNGLTDVELALITGERDLEHDFGIGWRRSLSANTPERYAEEQQKCKKSHFRDPCFTTSLDLSLVFPTHPRIFNSKTRSRCADSWFLFVTLRFLRADTTRKGDAAMIIAASSGLNLLSSAASPVNGYYAALRTSSSAPATATDTLTLYAPVPPAVL